MIGAPARVEPEPPDPKSGALSSWNTSAYNINITFYGKKITLIAKEDKNLRVDVFINKLEKDLSRTGQNLILNQKLTLKVMW